MELFLIYLWLNLSTISVTFTLVGLGLLIVFGIKWIYQCDELNKKIPDGYQKVKHVLYFSITAFVIAIFIPTKTDVAILVGSSIALDMAKSPEGAKVATLLRGKANELLDAEIAKIVPVEK